MSRKALSEMAVGAVATVRDVPLDVAAELGREGLVPGARIVVKVQMPFGGPIIVSLGRGRLALGRALCRSIEVSEP